MEASELARLTFFSDFEPRELELLAGLMTFQKLDGLSYVFRKGDRATHCFFVLEGAVEVSVDGADGRQEVVATLESGSLFGEIALVDGGLRSASCRASMSGVKLAGLGRAEFDQIFNAGSPFAYKLMDLIGERVVTRVRSAAVELLDVVMQERAKSPYLG